MDNLGGGFGASFISLQLQLNTLFEEVGGDHALELMDELSKLSSAEQKIILNSFRKVIGKIVQGDVRLFNNEDVRRIEFEEALYQDIIEEMKRSLNEESTETRHEGGRSLRVVEGGKRTEDIPINLSLMRKLRADHP